MTEQEITATDDEWKAQADDQPPIPDPLEFQRKQPWLFRQPGNHIRAGYSKNKGQGTPKHRRKQAELSRKINRRRG